MEYHCFAFTDGKAILVDSSIFFLEIIENMMNGVANGMLRLWQMERLQLFLRVGLFKFKLWGVIQNLIPFILQMALANVPIKGIIFNVLLAILSKSSVTKYSRVLQESNVIQYNRVIQ